MGRPSLERPSSVVARRGVAAAHSRRVMIPFHLAAYRSPSRKRPPLFAAPFGRDSCRRSPAIRGLRMIVFSVLVVQTPGFPMLRGCRAGSSPSSLRQGPRPPGVAQPPRAPRSLPPGEPAYRWCIRSRACHREPRHCGPSPASSPDALRPPVGLRLARACPGAPSMNSFSDSLPTCPEVTVCAWTPAAPMARANSSVAVRSRFSRSGAQATMWSNRPFAASSRRAVYPGRALPDHADESLSQ